MLCRLAKRRIHLLQRLISDVATPTKRSEAICQLEKIFLPNLTRNRLRRQRQPSLLGRLVRKIEATESQKGHAYQVWAARAIYTNVLPIVREVRSAFKLGDYPKGAPSPEDVDDVVDGIIQARTVSKVLGLDWRELATTAKKPSVWLLWKITLYLRHRGQSPSPSYETVRGWVRRRKKHA
jgi:hypothetical protein